MALKVLLRSQRDGVFDALAEALHAAPSRSSGKASALGEHAGVRSDEAFGHTDESGAPAPDPLIAEGLISAEDAPMPVHLDALARAFGASARAGARGDGPRGSLLETEKALSLRAVVCMLHGACTLPGQAGARRLLAARVSGSFAVHALGPLPLTNAQLLAMAGARQAASPGGPQGPPGMAQMASEQVLRPVRFEVRARSDLLQAAIQAAPSLFGGVTSGKAGSTEGTAPRGGGLGLGERSSRADSKAAVAPAVEPSGADPIPGGGKGSLPGPAVGDSEPEDKDTRHTERPSSPASVQLDGLLDELKAKREHPQPQSQPQGQSRGKAAAASASGGASGVGAAAPAPAPAASAFGGYDMLLDDDDDQV